MSLRKVAFVLILVALLLSGAPRSVVSAIDNNTSSSAPLPLAPGLAVTNEFGRPVALLSLDAYRTEFRYLRRICRAINLSGPPRKMTGLQRDVPETQWPFMQFCYFGFACVNLAECDPDYRAEALREARWLLEALQTPRLTGFIADYFGPPFGEKFATPSVFVHGLFLNLALRYRAISADTHFDLLIHRIAGALSREFARSEQGMLPTYPDMWWITDNLPALSALVRHDQLFKRDPSSEKDRFLRAVRTHYLDKKGMLSSYVDPVEHRSLQGARGVGISYALHFLKDLDPNFARNQYALAKRELFRAAFGFAAVREFPEGVKEEFDVDSGPVVFGFGAAASGFGIAAAALMGDEEMATQLLISSVLVGIPTFENNELRYEAIPPVGQSVVLFGKTELLKLQRAKSRGSESK